MPNWVFNSLVVSGEKEQLDKMVAQLNQPFTTMHPVGYNGAEPIMEEYTYNNPVLSFWNIVAPDNLDTYFGKEKEKIDMDNFVQSFTNAVQNDNSWYYWNLRNWGCKWDASDVQFEWTDNTEAMYHFSTPWSPAVEVIETLSTQYPTLKFNLEFEEEQGWGAEMNIVDGEQELLREWDIPNSHADHKALDRECSCEIGDLEYAYPDCPVTDPNYYYDEEQYGWYEKVSDPSAMIESSN